MADAPTITIPDTQGTQEIVPESQWAGCRQPDSQEPTTQVVEMPEASVAPIEAAKPVASPTAPEALEDDVILCCKCKIEVTIENMAAPKKVGSNVKAMCRNCHAVTTMLYRYLGTTLPEEWHQLTADQQHDFFSQMFCSQGSF